MTTGGTLPHTNAPHILDNPIWHALHTGNRHMASGNAQAKLLLREAGIFAGMQTNSIADLDALAALLPPGEAVVLFTPGRLQVNGKWQVRLERSLLQMIYLPPAAPAPAFNLLQPLTAQHVPAMLALTELTKPGPFLQRTIEFGNYEGVFENGTLVAMTGQRLQPDPYTEVSAVCTHPDHCGKGYAAALIRSQLHRITQAGRIPFLHVYPENTGAVALYRKLGFTLRAEMMVYVLERV